MKKSLRELRLAASLTREQLAAKAGVSFSTIVRAEAGDKKPQIDNAVKIAEALDVRVEDIAWGATPPADAETDTSGKDARAAVA